MFDGTEPENPIEVIDVVKILILEEKIDAIIGFGGGSAMDLAKCTRTMTVNERPIQNYYDLRVPRKTNPIPMILIPTTAGTSSEVSHDAVAYDPTTFFKKPQFLNYRHYLYYWVFAIKYEEKIFFIMTSLIRVKKDVHAIINEFTNDPKQKNFPIESIQELPYIDIKKRLSSRRQNLMNNYCGIFLIFI